MEPFMASFPSNTVENGMKEIDSVMSLPSTAGNTVIERICIQKQFTMTPIGQNIDFKRVRSMERSLAGNNICYTVMSTKQILKSIRSKALVVKIAKKSYSISDLPQVKYLPVNFYRSGRSGRNGGQSGLNSIQMWFDENIKFGFSSSIVLIYSRIGFLFDLFHN